MADTTQTDARAMLYVGFSSWLIWDGRYPDLRVGESSRFGLEFYPLQLSEMRWSETRWSETRWSETPATLPTYSRLVGSIYRVTAKVVFMAPPIYIIDFGLLAYTAAPPPQWLQRETWLVADIFLRIDQRIYSDHRLVPAIPELDYLFWIHNIELETTPRISYRDRSGRCMIARDRDRLSYRSIVATNARTDDHGSADYLLGVEQLCDRI
jgi:hypothetical protein